MPADFIFFSSARSTKKAREAKEDVRLDTVRRLVVDGAHFDDILKPGKCPLHFTEIFVDFDRFYRGEILLLPLNEVFALQRLFLLEVFRIFEIMELAVLEFPIVVAQSMVAH
jgi:hypothetical protein